MHNPAEIIDLQMDGESHKTSSTKHINVQSYCTQTRFKQRITQVESQILKINVIMHEFLDTMTCDFNRMVMQSVQMHDNLSTLKKMVRDSDK